MPELAEVEYFRRLWNPGLGKKIDHVHFHPQARVWRGQNFHLISTCLSAARLKNSSSHGKQMLFQFSHHLWLGIHLGMTGSLRIESPYFIPQKHDHLVLYQKQQSLVFTDPRLFGRLLISQSKSPPEWWQKRGVDLLSPQFNFAYFSSILQRRSRAPLKALLLQQNFFPGIGNWMGDEILWRSQLAPTLSGASLRPDQRKKLYHEIQRVCRLALKTITPRFEDPPDSWLFNHRWHDGGTCPRCQSTLQRREIGGRTTCWCSHCQPGNQS